MWSFRKEIHKVGTIGKLGTPIDCDSPISVQGNAGIYLLNINVGTKLGRIDFDYDAINIPDRFQVIYNGNIEVDSKYVGDQLASNTSALLNSFTLPQKEYDGSQFINNGVTESFTNTLIDIADGSISEPTDGQGTISFFKTTAIPTEVTIKVYAPLGLTAWNGTLFCPAPFLECGTNQSFTSPNGAGTYFTEVEIGTDLGVVTLDYDAASIPDRFQILYDGNIVADSLFVGNFLTGNPPDANTALWEGSPGSGQFVGHVYNNIPEFEWDGGTYVANGNTNNFTVAQSDVAPFGQTAGTGQLSFNKTTAGPTTMTVIATSLPANTGWDFMPNCPTQLSSIQLGTDSVLSNWSANEIQPNSIILDWDVTGGVIASEIGTKPDIDLSSNTGIADINVENTTNVTTFGTKSNHGITYLDISNNPNLDTVYVQFNELTSVTLGNTPNLTTLSLDRNLLPSIDVSNTLSLLNLSVSNNNLTTLDLTNNINLDLLNFSDNNLTTVDLSSNIDLVSLVSSSNVLGTIDVSNNVNLDNFDCIDNSLTSLDVTTNILLTRLRCRVNSITSLDTSNNINLNYLDAALNSITSLDVSNNTLLTEFILFNNSITSLDVSNNTLLTNLSGANNNLTTIDVSNNTLLMRLDLSGNNLTTIDVSNNTLLTELGLEGSTSLTSLDLSTNTLLIDITIIGTGILGSNLDVVVITLDNHGLSNGYLGIPVGRTTASDAAVASLQSRGWNILEF